MDYVKSLLSKEFKDLYTRLDYAEENVKLERISETQLQELKLEIYPMLNQLIKVCRLIMSMTDIQDYLMPYSDFCDLEKTVNKPIKVESC